MITGQITLNGITDKELIQILEAKTQHEAAFNFNPQQLQPVAQNPGKPRYNNATLHWASEEGAKIIIDLAHRLLHGSERFPAQ